MEDSKFDALVKRLVDESSRRGVLRGAAGTALASALAVAGVEAIDAKSGKHGKQKHQGKDKHGRGKEKAKAKGHDRAKAPASDKKAIKPAGPCGNGSVPANKCRVQGSDGFSNDCCTNYCRKTHRKGRPKNSPPPHDPDGRCRLAPDGFPCTQSQFCKSGYCAPGNDRQDEGGTCQPYQQPEGGKLKKHGTSKKTKK